MTPAKFRLLLLRFALLPLIFLCAFVGLISLQIHRITESREHTSQATTILLQCNQLLNSLVDEETGVRGYLATHDASFLEPYQSSAARLDGELDELTQSTAQSTILSSEALGIRADFEQFTATNRAIVQSQLSQAEKTTALLEQKQATD